MPVILENFLPGQAAGKALVAVLTGEVNPAGRLPYTWPLDMKQVKITEEIQDIFKTFQVHETTLTITIMTVRVIQLWCNLILIGYKQARDLRCRSDIYTH